MKKLLKGMMGLASVAAVGAGVYYVTKKLLEDQSEDADLDFDDVGVLEDDEDSREYVTLDIDEEEAVPEENIAENGEPEADIEEVTEEDIAENGEPEDDVEEVSETEDKEDATEE